MTDFTLTNRTLADLWQHNPVLVQLFGLSPLLAVSGTLVAGFALGLATLSVLVVSSAIVHGLRNLIDYTWRFVWYLGVLATVTTILDILMQWQFFPLYRELGVYLPLVCCNFVLLLRMEQQRDDDRMSTVLAGSALLGLGFLLAISGFSAIRELLVSGTLLQNGALLLPGAMPPVDAAGPDRFFGFAALQPGAFILLGLLLAAANWLAGQVREPPGEQPWQGEPAARARVTGKS